VHHPHVEVILLDHVVLIRGSMSTVWPAPVLDAAMRRQVWDTTARIAGITDEEMLALDGIKSGWWSAKA
jgi:hypothetical protein